MVKVVGKLIVKLVVTLILVSLVSKDQKARNFTCFTRTKVQILALRRRTDALHARFYLLYSYKSTYLLYSYKSTDTDAKASHRRTACSILLALLVQKYRY